MNEAEEFVRVCGKVGNYSKRITGNSIVDAYFGPQELAPALQDERQSPDELLHELGVLLDECRDRLAPELRREYMLGEIQSMQVLVSWLAGKNMSYADLVEGLFGIEMVKRFSEREIADVVDVLRSLLSEHPGRDLQEKVQAFEKEGRVKGEELKSLILSELQQKAQHVGQMFRERVFCLIGEEVTDNGVEYKTVQNEPWSGYNYYQGNYLSLNCFNIDRPFSKDRLLSVVYHEYEHHVSNLWREKAYAENDWTELGVVVLHTGRCVISEGTADTAQDFLEVSVGSPRKRIVDALYTLSRMVSVNAAIMLNHEKRPDEDVVDYISSRAYRRRDDVSLAFTKPTRDDGRPNLWAPYVFNYFIGRTRFVQPAFEKAKYEGELKRFFRTVYLNPFSLSSRTWSQAFDWL